MPFTFSHPAIVLPLTYLPKKYYSLTGLIVGSVTPDFEYFLRMKVNSVYSHTIPGMFWYDLPLGLIIAFVFHLILRDSLIINLPGWFARRMNRFVNFKWADYFFSNWFVVLISLLIGIASHLFWDDFTHKEGYFVRHIPVLAREISIGTYPLAVYHILQHASTIIGAAFILYAIKLMPEDKSVIAKPDLKFWIFSCAIMLVIIGAGEFLGQDYLMYGQLFITGISGGLIGLLIMSIYSKYKTHW